MAIAVFVAEKNAKEIFRAGGFFSKVKRSIWVYTLLDRFFKGNAAVHTPSRLDHGNAPKWWVAMTE